MDTSPRSGSEVRDLRKGCRPRFRAETRQTMRLPHAYLQIRRSEYSHKEKRSEWGGSRSRATARIQMISPSQMEQLALERPVLWFLNEAVPDRIVVHVLPFFGELRRSPHSGVPMASLPFSLRLIVGFRELRLPVRHPRIQINCILAGYGEYMNMIRHYHISRHAPRGRFFPRP